MDSPEDYYLVTILIITVISFYKFSYYNLLVKY